MSPSPRKEPEEKENKKSKANTSAKTTAGKVKKGAAGGAKKEKTKPEGTRKSARVAGKRGRDVEDDGVSNKKAKK